VASVYSNKVPTMLAQPSVEWDQQSKNGNVRDGDVRKGREEGFREGARKGEDDALLRLLEPNLGEVPISVSGVINAEYICPS